MTQDSLIGKQLDEYRLESLLGKGGMASVYRALDVRLKRYAAIKVIDVSFRADSEYMLRFEHEAQAIAKLEHPHIVSLYRYGEVDGLLYMAMQYIKGSDLGSVLDSYKADGEFIEIQDARRIIRHTCLALDYAHSKGVIHRDVKPANVMLDKQGFAFLTDFGLALLTEVGTRGEIFGSPHYISPEQAISSAKAVPQSDIYSMGVILYEMFTNQLPFDAEHPLDVAMLHMSEPPRPPREVRPDLNLKLEAVILGALEKEPTARYPNGAALADALDQALRAKSTYTASPRMTIPERVAIEIAAHPLPPIPAPVSKPQAQPTSGQALVSEPIPQSQAQPMPGPAVVSEPKPAQRPYPPPAKATKPQRPRIYMFGVLASIALLIICVLAGGFALMGTGLLDGKSASQTPPSATRPGQTPPSATRPSQTQATGTNPAKPSSTSTAPSAATQPLTPQTPLALTDTPLLTPSSTPDDLPTLPTATVLYPDGRHFVIYYDENSLYVLNNSGKDSAINPIAFERLDASGASANRFEGWRWSQYHWEIMGGWCVRVEVWGSSPYLNPPQCGNKYNSRTSAARDDDFVFWTIQEGSHQFRVLWSNQEVARCEIGAGVCDVFLP